ncbi:MAG: hypothetical protein A2268_01835 [Candidatus Raymondbacteria bacterium RifOxyA12_full_50_37]|uniref:Transporter n=1 Tax=Candidatus Raymondbacteria bacterium RIFOXYD12_FULL_49_13 TaxID=1817890 RepID=A0A1F7FHK5_UNCRA|nr:MAG: hypothetical protein A2268_01835 [Candidatus Raymondbacteria bacterium RifOxyA12_full_50_37]OGJ89309.1 MAG: hypothetical protein A2248_17455 [Candidatus Raymondbacteria bacterium RIFOXYA2_FULL_49_16]OGK00718.1 MAG: hypothetical protein A2350_18075 [Candidatus Raymondbacteria bacterium RifOxyB12_full_50_8]OGK04967.1 MAG: hypothetical protein A2487_15960 [Candidatus Raymondbacteria bacterium RifOxyC12_full_50_8]OGK06078.1 MAG: hypothetical protein A2519_06090 [Candidatus Raymondbacteria b
MRRLAAILAGAIGIFSALSNTTGAAPVSVSSHQSAIRVFVNEALEKNPLLKAYALDSEGAERAAVASKGFIAPEFSAAYMPGMAGSTFEIDYSLQQMIMFPVKWAAMNKAALSRAIAARAEAMAAGNTLALDIAHAYNQLYYIDRKLDLVAKDRQLLQVASAAAKKQYEIGMGSQAQVLTLDIETERLATDSISLGLQRVSAAAMLTALLGDSADRVFAATPECSIAVFQTLPPDSLALLALAQRPDLAAMEAEQAMALHEKDASRMAYFPDFMIGAGYRQRQAVDATDSWSIMAGITLPFAPWSLKKYSATSGQMQLAHASMQKKYENMKNMVKAEVLDALSNLARAASQLRFYGHTGIPKAELSLQSAIASYQQGKTEFSMVIDNVRMVIMAREQHALAAQEYLDALARLDFTIGLPMPMAREGEK